jgi:predicted transposase/invertase (TIGR01784 family)
MAETIAALTDKAREAAEEEEIPAGWLFLQELKAKGRDEGKAEGKVETMTENIRRLKAKGFSAKHIAEIWDMTVAEVEKFIR